MTDGLGVNGPRQGNAQAIGHPWNAGLAQGLITGIRFLEHIPQTTDLPE